MSRFATILVFAVLSSAVFSGCGAFADATEQPDAGPTLSVDPQFLQQGREKIVTLTYLVALPWANETGGTSYVVKLDLGGDDLQYKRLELVGANQVSATLVASQTANTGERTIELTTGFEKVGQKQQEYTGWDLFYVHPGSFPDGGSGDGGAD